MTSSPNAMTPSYKPTNSEIENLLTDIVKRNDITGVYRNADVAGSGWEAAVTNSYSEFLTKDDLPLDTKQLLKVAHGYCNRRAIAMLQRSISVSYHPKDSFTNGKKVYISSAPVDDVQLSSNAKLDVLLGLTTHECLHILETDFNPLYIHNKFQKTILNILEDERIEHICGTKFSGFAAYLIKVKLFYFKKADPALLTNDKYKAAFSTFFNIVRMPAMIERTAVIEHYTLLAEVKQVLTPYPETFDQAYLASLEVEKIFLKYFNFDPEEKEREENGEGETLEQIAEQFDQLMPKHAEQGDDISTEISKQLDSEIDFQIAHNEVEESIHNTLSYFIKGTDNKAAYDTAKSQVFASANSLANTLKLILRDRSVRIQGLRSGKLDESKIVDCAHGSPLVYAQTMTVPLPEIHLALCIDQSGSMNSRKKMERAQQTAVLFQEAAKLVDGLKLYAYGYQSDVEQSLTNNIFIYSEPGFRHRFALGSVEAGGCNRDGDCLLAIADRVRSFTDAYVLMVVISDGQPSADQYNGIPETHKAVQKIMSRDFSVFQIGIEVDTRVQAMMFKNFTNLENNGALVSAIKKQVVSLSRMVA